MSDSAALDSFLEKWRARWPEWSVAEVFVAPARRDIVVAWFALLQEFEDVLNIAGDPLPADAKLAWWGEELRGWASQRSRHPLGRRLEPVRADWARLADALPTLAEARTVPRDREAGFAALSRYGEAVAAVESGVLGARKYSVILGVDAEQQATKPDRCAQALVGAELPRQGHAV